jgi:microcystin-dependent protein
MQPFLGQIAVFGFNFPPLNWALCQGQIVPIAQNTALFSLLGTRFGGDGRVTFALPNLSGQVSVGQGQLIGGQMYDLGDVGGAGAVALSRDQTPTHDHDLMTVPAAATAQGPAGAVLARPSVSGNPQAILGKIYNTNTPDTALNAPISQAGKGLTHENRQPYLVLNYCICTQGIFPPRG